jgi:hypothetical protein
VAATSPRHEPHGSWLAWLVVLALVGGGLFGWNALGRPGLRGRGAAGKAAPAPPPATLKEAKRLIAAGDHDGALLVLHEIRRKSGGTGEIYYLMGNEYMAQGTCAETMESYKRAVSEDARYARDATIVRNAIDCLDDDRSTKAQSFIRNSLGDAVLPQLRAASQSGRTAAIRKAAAQLARELGR